MMFDDRHRPIGHGHMISAEEYLRSRDHQIPCDARFDQYTTQILFVDHKDSTLYKHFHNKLSRKVPLDLTNANSDAQVKQLVGMQPDDPSPLFSKLSNYNPSKPITPRKNRWPTARKKEQKKNKQSVSFIKDVQRRNTSTLVPSQVTHSSKGKTS